MAFAILGAFLLGLAWIGLIALGGLLGWRGLRGHMIDQEPRCRHCGYSARGLPLREAACPECGTHFVTGAIAFGRRRPRLGLVFAGSAIILVAVAPLVIYLRSSSSPFATAPAAAVAAGAAAAVVPAGAPNGAVGAGASPDVTPVVAAARGTAQSVSAREGERGAGAAGEPTDGPPVATAIASRAANEREAAAIEPLASYPAPLGTEVPTFVTVDRGERDVGDLIGASGLIELGWQPVEFDLNSDDLTLLTPERLAGAMPESSMGGLIGQSVRLRLSSVPSSGSLFSPFEPVANDRRLRFGGAAGAPEFGSWRRPVSGRGGGEFRTLGTRVTGTRVTGTRAGK